MNGTIIDRESFGLWVAYAQQVAGALQRAQEVEERTILEKLYEFSNPLFREPVSLEGNPYAWCKDYVQLVKDKVGAYGVHMRVLDETDGEAYRLVGAVGPLEDLRSHTRRITRPGEGSCDLELLRRGGRITNTRDETRELNSGVGAIDKAEKYGADFEREIDSLEATAMLPLKHGGRVLGSFVVDSRQRYFFTERRTRLANAAAALGGAILGGRTDALRHLKSVADQEKRRAELAESSKRAEQEKAVRDAFEDVAHQIKGPLAEAVKRIEREKSRWERSAFARDFVTMDSLLRRVEGTAKLIGLFAALSRGEQLSVTGQALGPVELVRVTEQICDGQRPRISARRNIRIEVDHESLLKRAPVQLSFDSELLVQALSNVMDNAVKYSYSGTKVTIFGGLLKKDTTLDVFGGQFEKGTFFIGVTNKGIPILPEETHLVAQRHWRGEKARLSVGEGNGLGLYIVESIMRSHGGALQVLPTRAGDGITEVRLLFSALQ